MHHYDAAAEQLTARIIELLGGLAALDPTPLGATLTPAEMEARARTVISTRGTDPAAVLELFTNTLAPSVMRSDSPRFLAWVPSAPTKAAMLFDAVVSLAAVSGISWLESSGAIHAENEALRFIADAAGMPAGAGGTFVQGGSAANLSALAVARDVGRSRTPPTGPVRFAVTTETHASIRNTMRILGVDTFTVPLVDDRLTGDALAAALAADADPESVRAVCVSAGATNAGLVDDVAGIASVCAERNIWMHVDAAYGGGALLAPSVRHLFDGIEAADSLVVDPHKWLYAPLDCAALLYREPALARAVHRQYASYLDTVNESSGGWNPSDYAYQLTRRARGLPLWFSLAVHGSDQYRDAIEQVLATTRATAARVHDESQLDLVREPELSIVLFRRRGWNTSDYDRWSEALLRDGVAVVVPTQWHGETVARLCFLHPDTTMEIVDEILATTA